MAEAGARTHLPSASLSRSSEPSLLDLEGDRASARGPGDRLACFPENAQGNAKLHSAHSFPRPPTYPVIQSWSPSPKRKTNLMVGSGWSAETTPPLLHQLHHQPSTYLGL